MRAEENRCLLRLITLASASILLALASLLAVWWPARRAAQQDALRALNEN